MHKEANNKKAARGGRTVKTITLRVPAWGAKGIRAKAAAQDSTVSRYFRGLINTDFIQSGLGPLF